MPPKESNKTQRIRIKANDKKKNYFCVFRLNQKQINKTALNLIRPFAL